MSVRLRLWLFAFAAVPLFAMLAASFSTLHPIGHFHSVYGEAIAGVAVFERHATDIVAAMVFDYRGFDTLGEEFVFLASMTGLTILLRPHEDELDVEVEDHHPVRRGRLPTEAMMLSECFALAALLVFGFYITLHGQITPGGGFQGGVLLSSVFIFVYLAVDFACFDRLTPQPLLDFFEGGGSVIFATFALLGLFVGGALLLNFLPFGASGELLSAGVIPIISLAVGLEIGSGFTLGVRDFLCKLLKQTRDRDLPAGVLE